MAGRAKSHAQKKHEATTTRDTLYTEALAAYRAEQEKPEAERASCRQVCRRIAQLHHERTGHFVELSHTTLMRRFRGGQSILEFNAQKSIVTPEEAQILVAYIREMGDRGFPLDYRRLAEHANELLCLRLGASFPGVGVNWPERFVTSHEDELDMYWSRTLDSQRGRAVNPATNGAWWLLLDQTVTELNIQPENMHASDESAFTTGQSVRQRVIGAKGKNVQHQQRGGNRENITVLVTISADGTSLPPTVIYKGQHFLVSWRQNNPLNAS